MDNNTVLVIVVFAIIIVAVVLVYRSRTTISVKGPAGMGLDVNASNDPAAPTPGAVLEDAKSRTGGATVQDELGRGAKAARVDVEKDIKVINRPAPVDARRVNAREEAKREQTEDTRFKITLSHPKLLSKRYTASFMVRIYLPAAREEVVKQIRAESANVEPSVHNYDSELTIGLVVKVMLFSPEIMFSDPVIKELDAKLNSISFLGRPREECKAGLHQASLIICDDKMGRQYQSVNFPIEIVDFAFDHVSRPLLSNLMAGVLGTSSFVIFILTLLGQIDTAFGLTSGTTAGVIASGVYLRFLALFQRPSTSNP